MMLKQRMKAIAHVLAAALLVAPILPAHAAKPAAAAPAAQKVFASPDAAATALADAVRAGDVNALLAVVGPKARSWLSSGDPVADRDDWKQFLAAYDRRHSISEASDGTAFLVVGEDGGWPFPAPIRRKGDSWSFDTAAGREEVINRRVGRNELDTMQTLLAIVDAQREYAADDPDRNNFHDYARKFRSSAGKKDGLYWPTAPGEAASPLGELVAHAAGEGYGRKAAAGEAASRNTPPAYHGYHYRILTAQGKSANGGAYSYLVKDRLLGGFAILAYPAKYGVSGVMSFLVNHDGVIYEKDLGGATAATAPKMRSYDPGEGWKKAQ